MPLDDQQLSILSKIHEGMHVVDARGDKLGNVGYVQLADPEAVTNQGQVSLAPGEVVAAPAPANGDSSGRPITAMPVGPIGDVFGNDVPGPIRERLVHHGFFRVDGAFLFGKDRFVMPDQIAAVDGDTVKLRVFKNDLPTG
jgi:hypothetical protein